MDQLDLQICFYDQQTAHLSTHPPLKMRLPYAPSTPSDPTPENSQIYARIAARRTPRPITKLDLALLHAPPIANGWNELLGAIRTQNSLDQALVELAVCRVAVLNGAVYEWFAHAPLALKAGVGRAVLSTVKDLEELGTGALETIKKLASEEGEGQEGLSELQWAVVAYTDQMTRMVSVQDEVFEHLRSLLGDERKVVELTATIAAYNCVSRFLVALDVCEMNGGTIEMPPEA